MTLPENQPTNQDTAAETTAPVFGNQWRNALADPAYAVMDGWRMLPVQGKNPGGIIKKGWQDTSLTRADVLALPRIDQATGFSVQTGPQPDGSQLICFDFDGPAAGQWVRAQGIDPQRFPTFTVQRCGAGETKDGLVHGRAKLLFRISPEQHKRLGPGVFNLRLAKPEETPDGEVDEKAPKAEGIEVFNGHKQVVLLGAHPDGGQYFWDEGRGPNALIDLPEEWLRLALLISEAIETGRSHETTGERTRRAAATSSKDWDRMDGICPICGRPPERGVSHACSRLKSDPDVIRCFAGGRYSYKDHEPLDAGKTIQGLDGVVYAFTSDGYATGFGYRGNFRRHVPSALKPRDLGTYADADNAAAAATVDNILTIPPTTELEQQQNANRFTTDAVLAEVERIHAELQRLGFDDLDATPETRALKEQLQRRVAGEQVQFGRKNMAVHKLVLQCFGIKQTAWFEELKPFLKEAALAAADVERQRRVERFAQAAAELTADWNGSTAPTPLQAVNLWAQAVGPWVGEHKERPSNQALLDAISRSLDAYGARYNTMTQSVDLLTERGVVAVVPPEVGEQLNMHLAKLGWEVDQRPVRQAISAALLGRAYNPVADWLETIASDPTIEPIDLGSVASDCLGVHDDLSREMVRRWLIGAVARALSPGCRMEAVLILKSEKQGLGKSTFARCLCPPVLNADGTPSEMHLWFTNNASIGSDADSKLTMHCGWVIELQEMERFSSKRSTEELKTCITTASDLVRPPYGSAHVQMPRASVLIGTCNTEGFLPRDPTGTRRFWPVDLDNGTGTSPEHVEAWLTANRMGLWKAAMQAYRNGERWHLTTEQEQARHLLSMDYVPGTAQDDDIAAWVAWQPHNVAFQLQTAAWNSGAYNRDRDKLSPAEQQSVAVLLRQLGFTKQRGPKSVGKARRKPMLWIREEYAAAAKAGDWAQLKVLTGDPDDFIRQRAERTNRKPYWEPH